MPVMVLRWAIGCTHSPSGMNGVISMARFCAASASAFCLAGSDSRAKSARIFSITSSQGDPGAAFWQSVFSIAAETGLITSVADHAVKNAFQPPFDASSNLARRWISVPQSMSCISTLKPAFSMRPLATGARLVNTLRSVECSNTMGVPSYPLSFNTSCAFFMFDVSRPSMPAFDENGEPQMKIALHSLM